MGVGEIWGVDSVGRSVGRSGGWVRDTEECMTRALRRRRRRRRRRRGVVWMRGEMRGVDSVDSVGRSVARMGVRVCVYVLQQGVYHALARARGF